MSSSAHDLKDHQDSVFHIAAHMNFLYIIVCAVATPGLCFILFKAQKLGPVWLAKETFGRCISRKSVSKKRDEMFHR